jgi:hypothetical protein
MREDFKFPYRVITRQEEIEGNKAIGFIVGLILFTPIVLVHKILSAVIPGTVLVFVYLFLIVMGVSYLYFK